MNRLNPVYVGVAVEVAGTSISSSTLTSYGTLSSVAAVAELLAPVVNIQRKVLM